MKIKELKDHKIVLILLLLMLFGISCFLYFLIKGDISVSDINRYIKSYGKLSGIIFLIIFAIRPVFVFLPCSLMAVLAGSLFHPIRGFMYTMIGIFISATVAFMLSRYSGKEFVKKLFGNKIQKYYLKIENHGMKIIMLLRMAFIVPFDILSYVAGLTNIKYKNFIIGTMIGVMPEMISLTYLGGSLNHPFSKKFWFAIILVIVSIGIPFLVERKKTKKYVKQEI